MKLKISKTIQTLIMPQDGKLNTDQPVAMAARRTGCKSVQDQIGVLWMVGAFAADGAVTITANPEEINALGVLADEAMKRNTAEFKKSDIDKRNRILIENASWSDLLRSIQRQTA